MSTSLLPSRVARQRGRVASSSYCYQPREGGWLRIQGADCTCNNLQGTRDPYCANPWGFALLCIVFAIPRRVDFVDCTPHWCNQWIVNSVPLVIRSQEQGRRIYTCKADIISKEDLVIWYPTLRTGLSYTCIAFFDGWYQMGTEFRQESEESLCNQCHFAICLADTISWQRSRPCTQLGV